MDTNLILAIAQVVSVAFIPIIVWLIGVKYQDRKSKKEAQLRLFLILMANRQKTPISQEWVDALNSIDVVFQDNQRVRHAWRDYLDSLNQKSAHFDNQNSYNVVSPQSPYNKRILNHLRAYRNINRSTAAA